MNTARILILSAIASTVAAIAPAQATPNPFNRNDAGMVVNTHAPNRTIVVDANTRSINVTDGETVQFDVGGQRFSYAFNAWNSIDSVPLSAIVPNGVTAPKVRVYIAQNPLTEG